MHLFRSGQKCAIFSTKSSKTVLGGENLENITNAVLSLAERHLGEFRIRNGQVAAKYCPFCHGGDHGDVYSFAVGLYNGAWNCMRGTCTGLHGDNKKIEGDFKELCEYFGENYTKYTATPKVISKYSKKSYVKPDPDILKPITDKIITYFGLRKISEDTLKDFNISADDKGNIIFPFYRDNILTYVKYRKPEKVVQGPKEWMEINTEPILFGMDKVSFNKPLIICEGMVDSLSIYEAGCTNVVSVPAGCNNMEWITNCWDWLDKFQQIILFGDADEPGQEMVNTLMKRLGEDRCLIPNEYPEFYVNGKDYNRCCKDANEILYAYGPEVLKSLVENCQPAPIEGVLNLADVPIIDPTSVPRIYSKIPELDNMIGGFGEGTLTILTGKRGQGKSTIGGSFILEAIEQGIPACIYSGELNASNVLEWICLQATESQYIETKKDPRSGKLFAVTSVDIQNRIRKWINNKLYVYDNSYAPNCSQAEAIVRVFTLCARRYGCRMFLCDNVMSALISADEENRAQAKFAAELKAFAVKFKASVLCVCHTRKTQQGQKITNDDISGSSALSNLADTVISVEKPSLRIMKNRAFGTTGTIECCYNPANRRIYSKAGGDTVVFSWDHTGLKIPDDMAIEHPEFQIQDDVPQELLNLPYA